uniref:Uncharacterized protein n=1 Tax=Knipowitschia caucasica TaxID=637954 RepID=A0AAV2KJ43_KNICA
MSPYEQHEQLLDSAPPMPCPSLWAVNLSRTEACAINHLLSERGRQGEARPPGQGGGSSHALPAFQSPAPYRHNSDSWSGH